MPLPTVLHRTLAAAVLVAAHAAGARADGVPLAPVVADAQLRPVVLADGAGGAIVVYKTATFRVGASHVSGAGIPDGGAGFEPLATPLALESAEPLRTLLEPGGRLVVLSDRAAPGGPALTRLLADGATDAGFPVQLALTLVHPVLVPGLEGRTLLVSKGSDGTSFWTIRAAILDADGHVVSALEQSSHLQFFFTDRLDATTDGAGGLIAVMPYYDFTLTGSKDLCVFRLAADGTMPWGAKPRPIVAQPRDQVDPRILPDGAGGAFITWTDSRARTGSADIYILRVNHELFRPPGWLYYGQPVCDAPGAQVRPRMLSDAVGGVWVAWLDQRNGLEGELRYSHVLANGQLAPGFTRSGAVLCAAPGAQRELELAPDGIGGFFAVWRDERSGGADLYLHHVLPSGEKVADWPVEGLPLALAPGTQDQPAIAAVAGGRVVVAWRDARDGVPRVYTAGLFDPQVLEATPSAVPALALAVESPARAEVRARVTLPGAGVAELELLDIAGRRIAERTIAGPLHGSAVTLTPPGSAPPGVYLLRLRGQGREAFARVSLLR